MSTSLQWKPTGSDIAPPIPKILLREPAPTGTARHVDRHEEIVMTNKPTSTEKVVPISVGNPTSISQFIVDQSHMEEFTKAEEEKSSVVEVKRPPRGAYFTVHEEEEGKPNSRLLFLLEIPGCKPYVLTPAIANEHSDEDVIRPVLHVRYVTMLSEEEALWPLKLDPPDAVKPNKWNESAKNIKDKATGAWVRIISKQKEGAYRYQTSRKSIEKGNRNSPVARSTI